MRTFDFQLESRSNEIFLEKEKKKQRRDLEIFKTEQRKFKKRFLGHFERQREVMTF